MLLAHLLVAGVVEFVLTAGVITYLQRANVPILRINHANGPEPGAAVPAPRKIRLRGVLTGLAVLVVLLPLGLLATGTAFGEDGPDQLDLNKYGLDAVPTGLATYTDWWSHALFPGYDFKSGEHPSVGYYVSAVVGTAIIGSVVFGVVKVVGLARRRRTVPDEAVPS
jgi:cobalt/nickel transport system permease protein